MAYFQASSWFGWCCVFRLKSVQAIMLGLLLVSDTVLGHVYVNKFAVHIPRGRRSADTIAANHGFINLGQIGSLEDHYLFEHPHVQRRSADHSPEHHQRLSDHPHVQWVEQQKLISRKKRDFLPNPADQTDLHLDSSYGDTNEHSLHRNVRDVKKREDPNRPTMAFNDELYDKMWYFLQGGVNHTDMNVIGAWKKGITGKNVVVTILDDGIERDHSDLKDNYDPYASTDVNGHDDDPMPRYDNTNENRHGTRCAGEVSAKANNSKCIVGVAYDSKIGGVRMLDGDVFDAVEANSLSFNRTHIDIYSASWGPDDDGRVVDGPGTLAKTAFIEGIKLGRQGKGSVFVWASGNGGNQKDSCNCDGYTNSIYTLSVSSISMRGHKPWYLEECSSTLTSTYSSGHYDEKQIGRGGKGNIYMWASGNGGRSGDSCSCDGYTNSIYTMSISSISQIGTAPFFLEECASTITTTYSSGGGSSQKVITVDLHNKCTQTHTGTSASAPLAAGIIALILEANPSLTWRDVQYVTLMTSRPLPDGAWVTNGVGRQVSLRYGYGLMDATAMVELAEKWTNVPEQHICNIVSGTQHIEIPDEGYEEMLDTTVCAGTDNAVNFLEHVLVNFTIQSKQRGGLQIYLISPMGTRSIILPHRPNDHDATKGFKSWAFLSVHFWGENPVGRWKLEIEISASRPAYTGGRYQGAAQKTNKLVSWSLILHGTQPNPVNLKPVTPGGSSTVQPTASTGKEPTTTLDKSNTTTVATTTPPPTTQTAYTQTTSVSVETTAEECHPQCVGGCTGPAPSQCNACANYKMHDSGTCLASCPPAFYGQDSVCRPCPPSCDTCTTVSSSSVMCLTCKPGYLLIEGKGTCEQFCEAGYYQEWTSNPCCYITDAGHCQVCSGKCAECSGAEDRCTACRWGLQLLNNACVSQKEPCPAGEFLSAAGCVACPDGCFTCVNATNCTCCSNGSYLQEGSCVNRCDSGYLGFHVNYSANLVFQQCQLCDHSDCSVCPDGFRFVTNVCVQMSNCQEGTYFQWNSMSCKACYTSCRSCIGPGASDCLSCYPPFGYNSLRHKCEKCCQQTMLGQHCCHCDNNGKCTDARVAPSQKLFTTTLILSVLAAFMFVAIVFGIAFIIVCRRKKKVSLSSVAYEKLLQSEHLLEDDDPVENGVSIHS